MRLTVLTILAALLGAASPALPQTLAAGPTGLNGTVPVGHPALGPSASPAAKGLSPNDKRMLAEQKRLERIMTICIGC